LKEKLKCLIFIPIISRTYCDPKAFAWEHEFKAFVKQASQDQYGLKVRLPNGNIASRVLPIIIYDLDKQDIKLCESVLGGVLRGVEFIYAEPGVNRPLKPDDEEKINLNKTKYRNQINKVGNAIKEIILGLRNEPIEPAPERKEDIRVEDKPPVKEKSIIVLPFENMSSDPEQEYFSDGLTEEIITDLSRIHELLVISRTSAMMFKGSKSSVREITEKVNVRYVLEGSVRKAGNNLRITAQLIDGINDSHLWAEKYSGTLDDIFDIQEKVSRSIVEALRLKLTPKETKSIVKRPIENIQAYEYYLKGYSAYSTMTKDGLDKARQYYEAAIKIIRDNALLYAALGNVYIEYAHIWIKQEDSLNKAEEYARKALELDPETAQVYLILALCQFWRGITKNMVSLLKKGYSIDPNDIVLITYYGWSYIVVGRTSEALPLANRIIELDPFNPLCGWSAAPLFYMGKFMEAVKVLEKFFSPAMRDIPFVRFYTAFILTFAGKTDEALDVLEPVERISTSDFFLQNARLLKYALEGKKNRIRELMTEEFILAEKREGVESCWAASFFAILGDFDTALDWLENSVNRGFINYPFMSQYDPFLTKMRGNPRYDQLMKRVKQEWENFEI